jgi:hypothetical protein
MYLPIRSHWWLAEHLPISYDKSGGSGEKKKNKKRKKPKQKENGTPLSPTSMPHFSPPK